MPFRRSYRRYRRFRKLTKSNIYSNRSAKAQSKQIAALNRKVNVLTRANRPETQIMFNNFANTFTNSALSSNFFYATINPWMASYTGDDQAGRSKQIDGNFCRCVGISVKLVSQYSDNWRDTIADAAHDASCGYRLVLFQRKAALPITSNFEIAYNDVFQTTSSLTSDDTNLTLPLISGISNTFKILYAKTFTISRYHPTHSHNIYIPASKCLNFAKDVSITTASQAAKGKVYLAILTGGLHYDVDYTAQIKVAGTLKIAYTDN